MYTYTAITSPPPRYMEIPSQTAKSFVYGHPSPIVASSQPCATIGLFKTLVGTGCDVWIDCKRHWRGFECPGTRAHE